MAKSAKSKDDATSTKSKWSTMASKVSFVDKAASGIKKLKRKAAEVLSPKKKKKARIPDGNASVSKKAAPKKSYLKPTVIDVDEDEDKPEAAAEDEEAELMIVMGFKTHAGFG
ncbi:hypothetical protein BDZ97DRAFT_1754987 [Flammula alnicola]|nr:hypothetical protein BDZ97DRAFT_1754987 [Flammula alnicola]